MKIKIKPKFSKQQLAQMVAIKRERVLSAILLRMEQVGETFVNNARNNGSYTDRTGNLRSSVGYVILFNGLQLFDGGFVEVLPTGETGVRKGLDFIAEVAAKYPAGLVLVCVAGMHYAAAVESKGYEVITASAIMAKEELTGHLSRLTKKIESVPLK
jgi:hypothetical protein